MKAWAGAAGVCVNREGQILMVLQGKPEEEKRWSVPSGGKEHDESLEQCCVREVFEETGYRSRVLSRIKEKQGVHDSVAFSVTYFDIELTGGSPTIHDPDELIHEISWKSAEQIKNLNLSFPEDREFLLAHIARRRSD